LMKQRLISLATAIAVGAGATLTMAPAAHAAVPAPVLHYTFDGLGNAGAPAPANSSIADAVGTHAGTVLGTGATVAPGPAAGADRALQLPGGAAASGAAYVRIPSGVLSASGDVTLSAWVKWAGGQTCAWPYTLGASTSSYVFFTPSCGGNLIGAARSGSETRATGNGPLGTGWTHVAVVLKSGQSISTFLNGQQVATSATTITGSSALGTAALSGYLGRSFFGADPLFAGAIDDFRVYTAALTAAELAEVGHPTYVAVAQADAAAGVALGDTSAVVSPLTLPSRGAEGSAITWASTDAAVVSATGAVNRPAVGQPDAQVTLTPTYAFGDATVTGTAVEVTVLAISEDEVLEMFESQYLIEPVVASGSQLPALGDVDVSYASDSADVTVSEDGVLTSTSSSPVTAAVTVRLRAAGADVSKTFEVTVLPAGQAHRLLGYQRTPLAAQVYDTDLAYSLHLALAVPGGEFAALHDNTGVMFAQGIKTADHLYSTTTIRSPWVFHRADGGYGVVGVLANSAGAPLASHAGRLVYFESDDLRQFTQMGYVTVDTAAVSTPRATWDSAEERYVLSWTTASGAWQTAFASSLSAAAAGTEPVSTPVARGPLTTAPSVSTTIPGALPGNVLTIDKATADALQVRFGRIVNTTIDFDSELTTTAGTPVDLDEVTATLGYSDGSTVETPIVWDAASRAAVDFNTPGTYTLTGQLRDQRNIFPLAAERADPTVVFWEGKYLMVSTWDPNSFGSVGIPLRVSDTIAGLATAPEVRIVTNTQNATDGTRMAGCFWAPDIIEVDGQLQIFFAPCYGAQSWTNVISTVTKLRVGGDPANPADWSQPQKVLKADGSPLQLDAAHPGISLDMTYFQDPETETEYVVWSERYINSAHPGGTGTGNGDAELWIAEYDPAAVRLLTAPVLLNVADASWEQNNTDVVEGAFFTVHDDKIWMTYSGSQVDATYAVGLMQAEVGADLLDRDSWTEWSAPVVKSDTPAGQFGPGHSGFFEDANGDLFFVFHAKNGVNGTRDAGIRKVFWAADDQPILDMTDDERIKPEYRAVSATIVVQAAPVALDVSAVATTRCVAGKVTLTVTATNESDVPVSLAVTTSYGSKQVAALAPAKTTSSAYTTRLASTPSGTISVVASATVGGQPVSVTVPAQYDARTCG